MAVGSDDAAVRHVKRNYFLISCVVMCEPITSTMLLPFVYFMVRDFGYAEKDIGRHAGILTSCFFATQMVSTPLWCIFSNNTGRKPIVLIGLLATAGSIIVFGLSKSLPWAIAARCFSGLLNGNAPIARTMVGELAEATRGDKGKAFSLFGFCLASGWMIGPLIGGALARPAISTGVFASYPYLLPCLVTGLINLFVFIVTFMFLEETKPQSRAAALERDNPNESDPLLERVDIVVPPNSEEPPAEASNRVIQVLVGVSALFFFTQGILFDELFALFAASGAHGGSGLGFRPRDIAVVLTTSGPAMLLLLLGYSFIHKRVRATRIYQLTGLNFAILYPLFSFLPQLKHSGSSGFWVCLVALIMLRYATLVAALTSLNIMINDLSVPSERALLNGIGQSIGSLARIIGPTLGGSLWSWSISNGLGAPFDFHACFIMLSVLSLAYSVSTFWVSAHPGKSKSVARQPNNYEP